MVDFSKFNINLPKDLKTLDANKALGLLLEYKATTLSVLLVAVTVIGLMMTYNGYKAQAAGYGQDMTLLQEKMDAIRRHDLALKALKDFFAALPQPLEDEKLIDQVTDYAAQHNVTIINYAPGLPGSEKFYESSRMHLSVSVPDFNDLAAFVRTIERSPYFLKLESFEAGPKDALNAAGMLTAEIFISSMRMKE